MSADGVRYIRYRLDAVAREREETRWLEQGPPSAADAAPSPDAAKTPPSAPAERLRHGDGAPPSRRGGGEATPVVGAQAVSQLGTLRALASLVAGMDRSTGRTRAPASGVTKRGWARCPRSSGAWTVGSARRALPRLARVPERVPCASSSSPRAKPRGPREGAERRPRPRPSGNGAPGRSHVEAPEERGHRNQSPLRHARGRGPRTARAPVHAGDERSERAQGAELAHRLGADHRRGLPAAATERGTPSPWRSRSAGALGKLPAASGDGAASAAEGGPCSSQRVSSSRSRATASRR